MVTMKHATLLLTFFSVLSVALGQNEAINQSELKNEVGIDATGFIKNILTFGNSQYGSGGYSPGNYLLSYKRISHNQAIRIGLGGSYSLRTDTGGYNSTTNITDKGKRLDLRLGYEFRNGFGKRWLFYYGVDMLGGYTYGVSHSLSTSEGTPDAQSKIYRIGGGPMMGLEFFLNSRLSLSTEGSIYYVYSKEKMDYIFKDNPSANVNALYVRESVNIGYPLIIFIKYKF